MYNNILICPMVLLLLLWLWTAFGICQPPEGLDTQIGTIQGHVTDTQDNPLSDYVISAVRQAEHNLTDYATDNITYGVKTDAGGQFTFTNVPKGTYNLKARHFSTLLTERQVTVVEDSIVDVHFVIEGTGAISGFLLDSVHNRPLPITGNIKVVLLKDLAKSGAVRKPNLPGLDGWMDRTFNGKISNGYFEVKNLLSGRYRIIDSFSGYVFGMSAAPEVTVYPNSHLFREVILEPGASLQGRFVDVENGNPISGVLVSVASEKSKSVYSDGVFAHETESDINGEFLLTTPNDAEVYYVFTIIASHPRYQTDYWQWDMSPGKKVYTLGDLELNPFLSLQGKVTASNSRFTAAGLRVQLKMHDKSANFFRAAAQPEHTVQSDTDGNFLFSELHPIEYSLTISRNDVIIAYAESVNPQSKKHINIRLPKLKTLHGNVVDEEQRPIAGAKIYAMLRNENPHAHSVTLGMTQTGTNGSFQMHLIDTKRHLLSLDVSKKGHLSRAYPNVQITKEPLVVPLQKGATVKGRVILPKHVPADGFYDVKIFPENAKMEPTLNPLALNRPLLSRRFPVSDRCRQSGSTNFELDGLFEEKYTLYITGDGISATQIKVNASANAEQVVIVADKPTVEIRGQVLWAGTSKPVQNALVSRTWYPWELSQYDMSLTVDRFEIETDVKGQFTFTNLTQGRYQLYIRAVQSVFNEETGTYQRTHLQKEVTIPICSDNEQHIYLGKADGLPFSVSSLKNKEHQDAYR